MKPYYQHDGITIYHAEAMDVLGQYMDCRAKCFDLLLTDPPYGIGIAANPVRQKYEPSPWDDSVQPQPLMLARGICSEAIIWGGNYYDLPPVQGFLVWDKAQPEDFSLSMVEQAWVSFKTPAKLFRYRVVGYTKEHPTEKPEPLMQWCIRLADKAAVVRSVFDPFMGAGTTLVAAKRLGKAATGIEREERYCEVAAKRLQQGALPMEFSA